MRYAKLMKNDIVDTDEGIVVSVWLQGCPFRCKGCHNPETWDFNGGIEIEKSTLINNTLDSLCANGIKRNLSILGGEPLCDQNIEFTELLIWSVKQSLPDTKIYLWTGFEYMRLTHNIKYQYILDNVDIIITGPFIQEQRNITLKLRGSENQEIWRRDKTGILMLET